MALFSHSLGWRCEDRARRGTEAGIQLMVRFQRTIEAQGSIRPFIRPFTHALPWRFADRANLCNPPEVTFGLVLCLMQGPPTDAPAVDTAEQVYISSLALLKVNYTHNSMISIFSVKGTHGWRNVREGLLLAAALEKAVLKTR